MGYYFAKHEHIIDPLTYRCIICGIDEVELEQDPYGRKN